MLKLKIDTSELEALERAVMAELAALPGQIRQLVKDGAQQERREHDYVNRTGRLQRSTTGVLTRVTNKVITAELRMGMPYASYVVAKGLTKIGETAEGVEAGIEYRLEQIGKRFSK